MSFSANYKLAIIDVFSAVAKHYRINVSEERLRVESVWVNSATETDFLHNLARKVGLELQIVKFAPHFFDSVRLPLVVQLDDDQLGVVDKIDNQHQISVYWYGEKGVQQVLDLEDIVPRIQALWILRPASAVADKRVDEYIKPYEENWFKRIIFHDSKRYGDLLLGSLFANVLALSTTIFSMQVYDRVVPSQSISTLWVLFAGVMIAVFFEFLLRSTRAMLTDAIGKRADARITDIVFGHAIRLKTQVRSQSTGSFIAQIREIESVRELITSTTLGALLDLPFIIVFLTVLWIIGGYLVLVPLVIIPLLVIAGVLAQWPLARLSKEGMRESALRNAILVETVSALDDVKLLRAEQRFQSLWNQANDVSSAISVKQRKITNFLAHWTQMLQSMTFLGVLLVGAYLVMSGDLTTGSLVATSILSSRMIAPIAQWTAVFSRLQNVRVAYTGLNELMKRPVDQALNENRLQRHFLHGDYELEDVVYQHDPQATRPNLVVSNLKIKAGSKVGVIGRMGSGKSTLLHLLSGLVAPAQGSIRLDGDLLSMIDVSDIRRDVAYLTQNARLFHGSLRENLCMGRPLATSEELVQALKLSGAYSVLTSLEGGLDYMIQEGGLGLSGGQRQAILLARTLLMQPNIIILDEPTASMDQTSEHAVVTQLGAWFGDKTVIVATHRPAVLDWVDTLIVVDKGKIAIMGPKEAVLKHLGEEKSRTQAQPKPQAQVPSQESSQATARVSTQAAPQEPNQAVTQATTQSAPQAPTQVAARVSTQAVPQVPNQAVTQAATQTASQAPAQVVPQVPNQVVTQAATQTAPQAPAQVVPPAPNQMATQASTEAATVKVSFKAPTKVVAKSSAKVAAKVATKSPSKASEKVAAKTAPSKASAKSPSKVSAKVVAKTSTKVITAKAATKSQRKEQ